LRRRSTQKNRSGTYGKSPQRQAFNILGKKLVSGYYTARGEDFMAIEQFIERIILKGEDSMKDIRSRIFAEELDYAGHNGCSASAFICNDIVKGCMETGTQKRISDEADRT